MTNAKIQIAQRKESIKTLISKRDLEQSKNPAYWNKEVLAMINDSICMNAKLIVMLEKA